MTDEPGKLPSDNVDDTPTPDLEAQKKTDKGNAAEGDKLPEDHKFHGKSASDVAKAYEELEGKLGEQGQEISDLKNNVGFYQQQDEQRKAQEAEKEKPKEEWTDEEDKRFYANPRKFIQQEFGNMYQHIRWAKVPQDYQNARKRAYENNPEFAKGIEKEVDFLVDQSLKKGYVLPENAADEQNFYSAAALIRNYRNAGKSPSDSTIVNPVDSVDTLKPTGAKPDDARPKTTVKITEDMKKMVDYLGDGEVSIDEATEMAKSGRKERERMEE